MRFLRRFADNTVINSLAIKFRRRRFKKFLELIEKTEKYLNRPLRILDVGGTESFWEMMNYSNSQHHITLLNLTASTIKNPNINSVACDARNMKQFPDKYFDIVISNSVIEHVGSFADQKKVADEIKRVAQCYFIQTPSFFFPLEPHFLFPFFHWLPRRLRIWLIRNFSLGWFIKEKDKDKAAQLVDEIRLMKYSELKSLFPDAKIFREKFFGLTKSYIVIKS